jgi:hypothetical protein
MINKRNKEIIAQHPRQNRKRKEKQKTSERSLINTSTTDVIK